MNKIKINVKDIHFLQKRRRDDVGDVFIYRGRILRGIFPEKSQGIKEMFKNGFLDELIKKELFPKSWIVNDIEVEGYRLIVEHEKIEPIIYPQEWTLEMLKDSALTVLEVAKVARKYGYNMKDCHGLNVLIYKKPKFIDLGSFHKNKSEVTGWKPFSEFLRFYYYPLYAWSLGLNYTSKLSIFSANLTPHIEYYLLKYGILRILPINIIEKLIKIRLLPSIIACLEYERINKISNKNLRRIAIFVKKIINATSLSLAQDLNKLEKKIYKLRKRNVYSQWGTYHEKIFKKRKRFEKIINLINTYMYDARTAIDVGGNQGKFAEMLLERTNIKRVIVQDLDENAIDIGYKKHKTTNLNISFVNYNFMAPIIKTTHPPPWERFKSDIVIALALLHHLILSQGFALDDILKELRKYTKKYIIVEFMPRGLWTYKDGDNYRVPDWYNIEWFKKEFQRYFKLIYCEQIETNYVVFLGEIL